MDRKEIVLLVVEDNLVMLKMMVSMLEGLGYQGVLSARNGAEAWQIVNSETTVHLVLSDLVMPEMGGIELLQAIRASERLWELPFIMVTAEENQNKLMSSIEIEVDAYILKPFTPDKLKDEINRVLAQSYRPSAYHLALKTGRTLLAKGGSPADAARVFLEASRLEPDEADPYYFLATIHERQGHLDEAKALLETCIEKHEAYPKAYDLLGQIYRAEKKYAAERKILVRITALSPHNLERNLNLALACARVGDQEGVRKYLKVAARLTEATDLATFERIFRIMLEAGGMTAEAETLYRKYIDKGLESPRLLNKFALLFKGVKDFERAILFLERIVLLWRTQKTAGIPKEDMAVYYFNLAVAVIEQANTFAEPEQKKAGYEVAEKLIGKALACNIHHQDATKVEGWLRDRLKG